MSDVLLIGAGPAGMTAALDLLGFGLTVTIIDDQPAPGGRIFAAIERRQPHGAEDCGGAALVARFRAAGGIYLPSTEAWQVEPGPRVFMTHNGRATMNEPRFVLLATGAQERPMPFPGWQLPGVATVGAAQVLLKTARQIPDRPVWLAGSGPLLLLYAYQLLEAGGDIAGILDTTPVNRSSAAALLPGALAYGWRDLLRGAGWSVRLRRLREIHHVTALRAIGADRLRSVQYSVRGGEGGEIVTDLLLIHDGVIPGIHATLAAGCAHRWNAVQRDFEPVLDRFCMSSIPAVFVAGDGATIAGASAARLSGGLAAVGVALAAGMCSDAQAEASAAVLRRGLRAAAGFRRFIDAVYPSADLAIPDDTMVCRCEEVTAGRIRTALAGRPYLGPDGVKIATRAGMGPCQGRQCGLTLTRLVAEAHGKAPSDVGHLRIRPPLKPLTLGELATLETSA